MIKKWMRLLIIINLIKMRFISVIFFGFILIVSCKSESHTLPVKSYKINQEGVKEYYRITYSGDFVNQLGEEFVDVAHLENKVFIANFFFTRCPSICPPMRQQLISISESINDDDFLIISHTIDPTNDTPQILKEYAESTGISFNRWQFLTATEAQTKAQAKQYMTNFKPNEDGTDFYHSSYVALVDKNRMIRGFYDVLKPKEVELLKEDAKLLLD